MGNYWLVIVTEQQQECQTRDIIIQRLFTSTTQMHNFKDDWV